MNRRGFFGALVALATAPKAVKFLPLPARPSPSDLELAFIQAIDAVLRATPQPDVLIMSARLLDDTHLARLASAGIEIIPDRGTSRRRASRGGSGGSSDCARSRRARRTTSSSR